MEEGKGVGGVPRKKERVKIESQGRRKGCRLSPKEEGKGVD
jgi:hypothetical protein